MEDYRDQGIKGHRKKNARKNRPMAFRALFTREVDNLQLNFITPNLATIHVEIAFQKLLPKWKLFSILSIVYTSGFTGRGQTVIEKLKKYYI